jgi:hypothetical protein
MIEPSFCVRFFSLSAILRFKAFPSSWSEELSGDFLSADLFSEDVGRVAGSNESQEFGPQVPVVSGSFLLPGCGERLARA